MNSSFFLRIESTAATLAYSVESASRCLSHLASSFYERMLPTHEGNDDSREDDDATITDEFEQNHATGENFGDLKYGANHVEKISLGKSVEETAKLIVSENVIARLFRNIPILKLEVSKARKTL